MLPAYDSVTAGNVTDIYLPGGEAMRFGKGLSPVLRDYLDLWALKKSSLQYVYADDVQHRLVAPLAICTGHTLVPLRARHPVGKHDGAYGYVELESLRCADILPFTGGVTLQTADFALDLVCTKKQVLLMISRGEHAARMYAMHNAGRVAEVPRTVYISGQLTATCDTRSLDLC